MQVPLGLSQYTYYGRGPWNNYNDRCTGSFIEMYQSTVKEQFVDFPKPQSMGNREEVRWCALTDKREMVWNLCRKNRCLLLRFLGLPWS